MTEGWFLEVKFTVGFPMSTSWRSKNHEICNCKNGSKRWQTLRPPIRSVMFGLPTILQVQSVSTIWIMRNLRPFTMLDFMPPFQESMHSHTATQRNSCFFHLSGHRFGWCMESCWVCRNVRKSPREDHSIDWGEKGKPENQDNLFLQKAQIKEKVD